MNKIYEIPGKVFSSWEPSVKAMIDTWSSYAVSLAEFKEVVLSKGVSHAKLNGAKAWIVDSSQATGAFSKEIQSFIGSDIFPAFAKIGIKYFITITSQSAITRMSISSYTEKAGPNGLSLLEVSSTEQAFEWLKKNLK